MYVLSFFAVCVTIFAIAKTGHERYQLYCFKRAKNGHLCRRLRKKSYFGALDIRYINYGWFVTNYTHLNGIESDLLKEYCDYFYQVPDNDIFFQRVAPKMKSIVKDIKENGKRDILHDVMQILRDDVNTKPWLEKKKHRKQIWDTYWKKKKKTQID